MTPAYPDLGNILVIQLGDIGDVVLATPSFRAFREVYPSARISVLVRKGYGSLLDADPHVSEVIEIAKKRNRLSEMGSESLGIFRKLRTAKYDLAIDLRNGDRGAILAWMSGAPVRISRLWREAPSWHRMAFTDRIDQVFTDRRVHPGGDQSLRLLRAIGVDTDDTLPRLCVSDGNLQSVMSLLSRTGADRYPGFATVNPFSRWKYKEWSYDKWVDVLNRLWTEHGLPSCLIGSKDEAEGAAGIAGKCKGPAFNFAGCTTLGELAALISRGRLHVGVDSAGPHIAAAVGKPTVTVFGPSNWRAWVLEGPMHRVASAGMDCVPCNRKGCDGTERSICLEELGVETVMKHIGEALRAQGATDRGGTTSRTEMK